MAFIAMIIAYGFVMILAILIISSIFWGIIAIILKRKGKKKDSKKLRITGNICAVLSILNITPVLLLVGKLTYNNLITEIELPNGEIEKVTTRTATKVLELARDGSDEAIDEIESLLKRKPALIYYNNQGILEIGFETGNAGVVRTAIEHGAVIDSPLIYKSYTSTTSMERYLKNISEHKFTKDDIEIITLLFENGADTTIKSDHEYYTRPLGLAVWEVLYNDEKVTDEEIEFIQVIIDNGITFDWSLTFMEYFPPSDCFNEQFSGEVKKDDNYYKLMEMVNIKLPENQNDQALP